jgi:hypothetical protein
MQVAKVLDVFLDENVHCCSPQQLAHTDEPILFIPGAYAWENDGRILVAVVKPSGPVSLEGFGLLLEDSRQEVTKLDGIKLIPLAEGLLKKDLSRLDQHFMKLIEIFKEVAGMFPATELNAED